ncbi:hypothetical protein OL239_09415 [Arthrobacter sp. ATA002]|uniref:hypothetical protein n=1 Tax=Arthrobacter sp. ATA002 TaxID=2991715 RepID=UPI0022A6E79D|nr:hypothetical protein [Arthrobacter sp. ATA002]WAP53228.1 hypothetical protein OL239_09415 [Arthrobacter sp. ATA002]
MSTTAVLSRTSGASVKLSVIAVWIVAVLAAAGSALESFTVITGRVVFALNGADPRLPLTSLPQINQAELREGSAGYLADAPTWLRVLCATPAMVYIIIALLAAVLITRALHGIAASRPFSSSVRRSMTILSLILIMGGILYGVLDSIAGQAIYDVAVTFFTQGIQFPLGADYAVTSTNPARWPFFMIITGVVGLALSSAFRAGARLEEAADGLV